MHCHTWRYIQLFFLANMRAQEVLLMVEKSLIAQCLSLILKMKMASIRLVITRLSNRLGPWCYLALAILLLEVVLS